MKILVTGGSGYIGTPLCVALSERHEVTSWDPGMFGHHLGTARDRIALCERRVQQMSREDLRTLEPDWIVHLAGFSNDPMADFAPALNWAENMEATRIVGGLAAELGVPLLFASSASVYGYRTTRPLTEADPVEPIGHYSQSKAAAESWLLEHHPRAVILRQGTVMGTSARMRLDLLTNGMTKDGWAQGAVRVLYGGREVRPQVHVLDLVDAYVHILESQTVPPGIYNVATTSDRVIDVAAAIAEQLREILGREVRLEVDDTPRRLRSYALETDKIRSAIEWRPRFGIRETVQELCRTLGEIDPEDPRCYNIRWMRLLHEAQAILGRVGPIDVSGGSAIEGRE
ncbi:MAG: NAD(P)-dependent oxidoreductase [Deltaproteobacteria bacterium]|nr:NAD(P)-dependent oxidoreductase [Deltaproteobacteria bacterium]